MTQRPKAHIQCVMPNLFYEYWEDQAPVTPGVMHIDPFLEKLVKRISRAQPSWRIFATARASTGNVTSDGTEIFTLTRFRFESAQREELGTMHRGYGRNGNKAFAIDNVRMSQARSRGDATYTSDEARAYKLIKSNFRPSPLSDIVLERDRAVSRELSGIVARANNTYRGAYNQLVNMMTGFAEGRWEEFAEYVREKGDADTVVALNGFNAINEHVANTNALREARDTNKGFTVYARDGEYVFVQGKTSQIKTPDAFTFAESACLGALQIQEVGTFIPNMGVRVSTDTYYILPALVPVGD